VTGTLVVFIALLAAAIDDFGFGAAILAGNGAAILFAVRLMRRWEREQYLRLLREPRWRWRWRRAGGFFDPDDFYNEPK
jgi:hypothetical protein